MTKIYIQQKQQWSIHVIVGSCSDGDGVIVELDYEHGIMHPWHLICLTQGHIYDCYIYMKSEVYIKKCCFI